MLRRYCSVLVVVCFLFGLLFSSGGLGKVSAASSAQIQSEIDGLKAQEKEIEAKLDELESLISENSGQIQDMITQKNILDQQIVLLHEQQDNNLTQIRVCSEMIAGTQRELEQAEENLRQLQAQYRERIRAMEEGGKLCYWSVLFHANSFSDFLDRMMTLQEISEGDQRRLQRLEEAAETVESARQELLTEQELLQAAQLQLQETEKDLEEKQTQAQQVLMTLVAKGAEYETLLHESEQRQEELMEELAKKETEYEKALEQESGNGGSAVTPDAGEWLVPVPYYTLSSPFGMRFHPILNIWRMHNGVDMGCAANTPIYASRSGVVTVAAYQADGAGNYVQLDHGDGYRSIYMHMTRYVVSPGQQVTAGQIIGYVGSTGLSKGNHLHFGISYNGTYVNPMEFLP